MKKHIPVMAVVVLAALLGVGVNDSPAALSDIENLGKFVFFQNISDPPRMACATCHVPRAGWTFGVSGVNLHQVAVTGANPHTRGGLKPPMSAYASFSPPFQVSPLPFPNFPTGFLGGVFWNGRSEGADPQVFPNGATVPIGDEVFQDAGGAFIPGLKTAYGKYLGPLAEQAFNPFLNPVEQNQTQLGVCRTVASAAYAPLFEKVWKEPITCEERLAVNYKRIAVSLAAYQSSPEVNSFSSKRDIALKRELDGIDVDDTPGQFPLKGLTAQENLGHDLFYSTLANPLIVNGVPKITNCGLCHANTPPVIDISTGSPIVISPGDTGVEPEQTYSDNSYHVIGVPPNPEIPGFPVFNEGLKAHTGIDAHLAAQRSPSLRNVDKRPGSGFVKAYTHNGWFKSLESLVHFYNTANVNGVTAASFGITECAEGIATEKDALANNCWPKPEFPNAPLSAINIGLMGDMRLTLEEEAALVAYLKTFTDTATPKQPHPYIESKPGRAQATGALTGGPAPSKPEAPLTADSAPREKASGR